MIVYKLDYEGDLRATAHGLASTMVSHYFPSETKAKEAARALTRKQNDPDAEAFVCRVELKDLPHKKMILAALNNDKDLRISSECIGVFVMGRKKR
tara:strand:- start:798 stop:1085 length:288 start_codon:yes stop_codon:yes gene_type:complete